MKKIIVIILFIFSNKLIFSQTDIITSFSLVDVGRNINLSLKKDFKKHSLVIGLKFHLNAIIHDNNNNVYRRRFYAKTPLEHWGLQLGYQYNFSINNSAFKPFLFYDFQFTNSHIRASYFYPYAYDGDGNVLYKYSLFYFGPIQAYENNIGVGFITNISKRMYFYQKAGRGLVIFHNVNRLNNVVGGTNNSWEFGYIVSAGIIYRVKEKKVTKEINIP